MQFSSMTAPASMSLNTVVAASDNECCRETGLSSRRNQQLAMAVAAACVCASVIVILVASAFFAEGHEVADCDDSTVSETTSAVAAFAFGWLICFIVKCNQNLTNPVWDLVESAKQMPVLVCAHACRLRNGVRSWLANQGARAAKAMALVLVGMMCTGCVIFLFVSAFTAVPDEEPAEDGLASESSPTMRAFTVGWMFMLTFKLRRELVGVVGSSCFLHPC